MSTQIRVGVIGVGVMGAGYAQVLQRHPQVTVTGVAARRPERASAAAANLPEATAFTSWQEMINSGTVDAICIATPDHLHTAIMLAAAEAGLHIACEKPFTTSLAEAHQARSAIEAAGVTAMTLFNHRWIPAYAQAKQAIQAGSIGEPIMISARKNDRIHVPTEMLSWADSTTSAWFLSSHDIDLACWFADDRITHVSTNAVRGVLDARGVDTYDGIQIQARFARSGIATFESCWIQPNTFPTMVDSYVQVIGTEGVIQLDRQAEQITLTTGETHTHPRNLINIDLHGVPSGSAPATLYHWVDCILEQRQPVVDLESSIHVTAILDAAHRAIDSSSEVAVPS